MSTLQIYSTYPSLFRIIRFYRDGILEFVNFGIFNLQSHGLITLPTEVHRVSG